MIIEKAICLFVSAAQKQRLQRRIQLLAHILEQHGRPKLDRVLQIAHHVPVRQLNARQLVLLLRVLDPAVGLALRIDHQRPPLRVVNNNGVVNAEGVLGQAENIPLLNFDGLSERLAQRVVVRGRAGDFL